MVRGPFCPGSWFFISIIIIVVLFSMAAQWSKTNSSCTLSPLSFSGSFLSSFSLRTRSEHCRLLLNSFGMPTAFSNGRQCPQTTTCPQTLPSFLKLFFYYYFLFYHRWVVCSCGSHTLFKDV